MKMLFFVAAVVLLVATEVRAQEIDCSYAMVQSFCPKLKALKGDQTIKFSDGSGYASGDAVKNRGKQAADRAAAMTQKEKDRRQTLFKETQDLLIQSILQGRSETDPKVTPAEKILIARVRGMTLAPIGEKLYNSVCVGGAGGTIGHDPASNSLVVCPEVMDSPNAGVVHAMAMFMAHGIDRCTVGDPTDKNFTAIAADQDPFSLSASADGKSLVHGGVRQCVTKGGAHEGLQHSVDFASAKVKKYAKDNEMSIDDLKEAVKNLPSCDSQITGDTSDSATSDWISSDVLARYLAKHPAATTGDDRFEPLAWVIDDACRIMTPKLLEENGHPDWKTRFNEIIFSNSRLRQALHCKPDPNAPICAHSVLFTPAGGGGGGKGQTATDGKSI